MIKTLNQNELAKVKEYAEWLKSGGDKLEFSGYEKGEQYHPMRYFIHKDGKDFIIWNGGCRGEMNTDINGFTECKQSHNCSNHDHFEYFKPIAENYYRKWKLKELCGDLFSF